MPSYMVTMVEDCTKEQLQRAKDLAISQGATITHEYQHFAAFAFTIPEGIVTTLDSHEHVQTVELDQVMTTQ